MDLLIKEKEPLKILLNFFNFNFIRNTLNLKTILLNLFITLRKVYSKKNIKEVEKKFVFISNWIITFIHGIILI